MSFNHHNKVEIAELRKDSASLRFRKGRKVTDSYYELSVIREHEAWRIELYLKPPEKLVITNGMTECAYGSFY